MILPETVPDGIGVFIVLAVAGGLWLLYSRFAKYIPTRPPEGWFKALRERKNRMGSRK